MIFQVNYVSNGPSFTESVTPKNITCTPADAGWSMTLPKIAGGDLFPVTITLLQDDDFSKLFQFSADTNILSLNPKYEKDIMSGKICPGAGNKLNFELNSSVLGKS